MGSSPSVIVEEPFSFPSNSQTIIPESSGNHRVSIQHTETNATKVTCFSASSLYISQGHTLTLYIEGAGVIRFGLTKEDPKTNSFVKDQVFEVEDGFSSGKSERCLFINGAKDICYGPRVDDHLEYTPTKDLQSPKQPVYLYVTSVYGKPTISVAHNGESIELVLIDDSLLENVDDQKVAVSNVTNTSIMKIQNMIEAGPCYNIHWNMELSKEKIGDKAPKHGYLRIGLVQGDIDVDALGNYSRNNSGRCEDPTHCWFTESAVAQFPYNGIIGFKVKANTVEHNLMFNSVGDKVTQQLPLDSKKPMYLLIEASSGTFSVSRSERYRVQQSLESTTVLVKDFREFEDIFEARAFITSIDGHEPYHIQYGANPRKFLIMFNKQLTSTDLATMKSTFNDNVEKLSDTDTVQIVYKTDDVPGNSALLGDNAKYTLEEAFTRRQQTGGGVIEHMKKVSELPECWIVKYKNMDDARRVWMRREVKIEGVAIRVLPWYAKLGPAINFGEKPVFGGSDLLIDDLDQDKLSNVLLGDRVFIIEGRIMTSFWGNVSCMTFIMDREGEKTDFERKIAERVPISITWPHSDGFERETSECLSINVKFHVDKSDYKQRGIWKTDVKSEIKSYFSTHIFSHVIKVDQHNYEKATKALNEHAKKTQFVWNGNRRTCTLNLICSDGDLLNDLVNKIMESNETLECITKAYLGKHRYHALEDEGQMVAVSTKNRNTAFVMTENGDYKIRGPKDEVMSAKSMIIELALALEEISEQISSGEEKLLKTEDGRQCLEGKLKNEKLNTHYEIREGFCKLWISVGNDRDWERKSKLFGKTVHSVFTEKQIPLTREIKDRIGNTAIEAFVQRVNSETVSVILDNANERIIVLARDENVRQIERSFESLIQSETKVTRTVVISLEVIDFISEFLEQYLNDPYKIERSDSFLTPKVLITASKKQIDEFEKDLMKEVREIKSHWFHISRPWLTYQAEEINTAMEIVNASHTCIVDTETVFSLVESGVSCIAIDQKSGAACTAICCDLTKTPVDAIVIPIFSSRLEMSYPLAQAVATAGGPSFIDECKKHVSRSGPLNYGDSILLGPGKLPCQAVVFICLHKNGEESTDKTWTKALTNCFKVVEEKRLNSVLIPASSLCGKGQIASNMNDVIKAISTFVSKNGCLKEIGLCDTDIGVINTIKTSMCSTLQKHWFVFNHGMDIKPLRREASAVPTRPLSAGRGQREVKKESLFWAQDNFSYPRKSNSWDDDDSDEERKPKFEPKAARIEGNLPYTINVTEDVEIQIQRGEIQNMKCDAIVNPTPKFPDLVGAISNALLRQGGASIRDECLQHGHISPGDVAITTAGNLSCKQVYHVLQSMQWQPDTGFDDVYKIVSRCLKKANEDNASSIALPAIGTGASRFPVDKVAEAMIKAVFDFTGEFVNISLKNITIVLFYKDVETAKMFAETVKSLMILPKDQGTPRNTVGTASKQNVHKRQKKKPPALPNNRPTKHSVIDDVLCVKVTVKGNVDDVIAKFTKQIDSNFKKTDVKFDLEENLNKHEVDRIQQLGTDHTIMVTIEQTKYTITLEGLKKNVDEAVFKLNELLKLDFKTERDGKKLRDRVTESVQWFYEDTDGELKETDDVSNFDIQLAYMQGKDFEYYNNKEGKSYRVLIANLEEHPVSDSTKRRRLIQKQKLVKGNEIIPDEWSIKRTNEARKLVPIDPTSREYDDVKRKFIADKCPCNQILQISRVEDRYKYLQYMSKLEQLKKQNPDGTQNEQRLWHGTDVDTVPKILKNGYDRSFAGVNGTVHGYGVYFATTSGYSHGFTKDDGTGTRRMFLNKVLVGISCPSNQAMTVLPERCTINNYKILFDSAIADGIYVIFHDTQAYPEHLIEYN